MKKLLLALAIAVTAHAAVIEQTHKERRVWIYTPPSYDAKQTYPLLILFDGETYLKEIPAAQILDDLIAKKTIRPVIAVMVDTHNGAERLADLANHQKFADYVANELLPWVRSKWSVSKDRNDIATSGYSAGGLGAAYVAFRHPEAIGNVFSQSGAFWRGNEGASTPGEWLTEQFRTSPPLKINFYIDIGAGETHKVANGLVFIETNRRLHDVLVAKGYRVQYVETPNAMHEEGHWRAQFPAGVTYLFAARR
jgi:enterochelin esterase family protein